MSRTWVHSSKVNNLQPTPSTTSISEECKWYDFWGQHLPIQFIQLYFILKRCIRNQGSWKDTWCWTHEIGAVLKVKSKEDHWNHHVTLLHPHINLSNRALLNPFITSSFLLQSTKSVWQKLLCNLYFTFIPNFYTTRRYTSVTNKTIDVLTRRQSLASLFPTSRKQPTNTRYYRNYLVKA